MTDAPPELKPLKTWSHLAGNRRKPSEYEIVSTNLLWHMRDQEQPFDVDQEGPMANWYREHRNASPVTHADWDAFRDPDELIYRTYNIMQDGQETYVEGLLDQHNTDEHEKTLSVDWVSSLAKLYAPGRYLLHTVQMASAYLVHMSPTSTISNCAAFQSSDQLRWVSHVAYRTVELGQSYPSLGFGSSERTHWEQQPAWQGFRELMERILATRDWAESFVALNLVAKPAIDEAFFTQQGASARRYGDTLFALVGEAALHDSTRSRRWSNELVRFIAEDSSNAPIINDWLAKWTPVADSAIEAFCSELPENPDAGVTAKSALRTFHSQLPLGS